MSFPGFPSSPSPGTPSSPITHNILSSTHGDTIAASGQLGDTIGILGSSGLWERIPIGANDQVYTVVSGVPSWEDSQGGNINTVELGATSTFVVDSSIYYNPVTSAVTGVILSAAPVLGQTHVIKDADGTAGSVNITIIPGGGFTVDGNPSTFLTGNYEAVQLIFGPTEWNII